jgi:hypothetical protein
MISPTMIDRYAWKTKKGEMTPGEVGKKIATPCPYGIFNVPRTVNILKS